MRQADDQLHQGGWVLISVDELHALRAQANTDPLTGLANRRAFDGRLRAALAEAARTGIPITVGLMDVDNFKAFNDIHGHCAGDRLLRAASEAWTRELRASDLAARLGGDEFALVLWDCDEDAALALTQRLSLVTPAGATCSVGVAVWDGAETVGAVMARADAALYAAKAAGRARACVAR